MKFEERTVEVIVDQANWDWGGPVREQTKEMMQELVRSV